MTTSAILDTMTSLMILMTPRKNWSLASKRFHCHLISINIKSLEALKVNTELETDSLVKYATMLPFFNLLNF